MKTEILILDAPREQLRGLAAAFRAAAGESGRVRMVRGAERLARELEACPGACLAVVDCLLGDGRSDGVEIIRELRARQADVPVVAAAERGDVELVSRAVAAGAADFLVRGENLSERAVTLLAKLGQVLELAERNRRLRADNLRLAEAAGARCRVLGGSPAMREILARVERVARIPRPVLIVGERGTGKEVVARAIHCAVDPARPMITVNCAAFGDSLLESELFGHEKGAFTGASERTCGKFEQAAGGTLFLDEIGNMTLAFQQKILRVVEYGVFNRVGGAEEVRTDARIIAATNSDLEALMNRGAFLRDLYDRLSFEVIRIPPLRERPDDVEELARHFLEEFMREIPAFRGKRLAASAVAALRGYDFPGNARELKNIIERAAYRDTTNEITPEDIGMLPVHTPEPASGSFEERVERYRRQLVRDALAAAEGNGAAAARSLGLSYHQFRYYLKKYGGDVS